MRPAQYPLDEASSKLRSGYASKFEVPGIALQRLPHESDPLIDSESEHKLDISTSDGSTFESMVGLNPLFTQMRPIGISDRCFENNSRTKIGFHRQVDN